MTAVQETLRTEYPFSLPRGYVDENGRLLRMLSMRHVLQAKIDELSGQLHKVQHA